MSIFNIPTDLNDQVGIPNVPSERRPLLTHDKDHDFILRIDNSTLEYFQSCARAAKFYCVDRRQGVPTAALTFGGAIHLGLETLYAKGFDALPEAIDRCVKYLSDITFRDPEEWRTPAIAEDTLRKYAAKYGADEMLKPILHNGKPFIEKPFSLVIGEMALGARMAYTYSQLTDVESDDTLFINKLTILWSGRIDIAATYGDDYVYVVDHKTSSIGGPQFFADFMLSQQMVGYNWALRQMLPEYHINGTVVNAIIQRKPTKTGRALDFERQTYFHTQWHVDEWHTDINQHIEHFVYSLVTGKFPKSTKWCFGKFGKCKYHDVCTLPPQQRHIMLASPEYTNVTWSPLDDR
jgi:hypothetical protein